MTALTCATFLRIHTRLLQPATEAAAAAALYSDTRYSLCLAAPGGVPFTPLADDLLRGQPSNAAAKRSSRWP